MNDANGLLKRQAAWQRSRAQLTWAEKINSAARIRNDILRVREENLRLRRLKLTANNE